MKGKGIVGKSMCEFCHYPFNHYAKYYIITGFSQDPWLYMLRKDDSVGGLAINYCPLCGRYLMEESNNG